VDHVHEFDPCDDGRGGPERFETQHWPHDAFDGAMVLLPDVLEILDLTNFNTEARTDP
jgi:hypothetical protein